MKVNNIFSHDEGVSKLPCSQIHDIFFTRKPTKTIIELVAQPDIGRVSRHLCTVQVVWVGQEVVDFVVGERVVPQKRDLVPV